MLGETKMMGRYDSNANSKSARLVWCPNLGPDKRKTTTTSSVSQGISATTQQRQVGSNRRGEWCSQVWCRGQGCRLSVSAEKGYEVLR